MRRFIIFMEVNQLRKIARMADQKRRYITRNRNPNFIRQNDKFDFISNYEPKLSTGLCLGRIATEATTAHF